MKTKKHFLKTYVFDFRIVYLPKHHSWLFRGIKANWDANSKLDMLFKPRIPCHGISFDLYPISHYFVFAMVCWFLNISSGFCDRHYHTEDPVFQSKSSYDWVKAITGFSCKLSPWAFITVIAATEVDCIMYSTNYGGWCLKPFVVFAQRCVMPFALSRGIRRHHELGSILLTRFLRLGYG